MKLFWVWLFFGVWLFGQDTKQFYVSLDEPFEKTLKVPNGTVLIVGTQKKRKPLSLGNRKFRWLPHPTDPNQKIALVSIPYRASLKTFTLSDTVRLEIVQGDYKQEQITVAARKAKPNQADVQRITRERDEANKIYSTYTQERYWDSPFMMPLKSVITSPYGSARMFNQEVKSFHSGTDFRAAIGTPIVASNDGVVVIAKERFFSGYGVVIDHGEGVFSMYYHCSELKVSVGQKVQKGELIALSGNTGRVSGPHLHFSFLVNGTLVDPIKFVDAMNALMP